MKMPMETPLKANAGFTLTELVLTMAIGVILAAIAAPAFNDFVADNRLITQTNDFITDLNLARSEAIKRNRRVTVCKSSNPTAADPICDVTNDSNWSNGWVVFIDDDRNGQRTTSEAILKRHDALAGGMLLYPRTVDTTIKSYVSYIPRGITQVVGVGTQTGIFRLCDGRGLANGRAITVSQTGRVSATAPPDSAASIGQCPPP